LRFEDEEEDEDEAKKETLESSWVAPAKVTLARGGACSINELMPIR